MKPNICYIADRVSVAGICTGHSDWNHTTFNVLLLWQLWVRYTLSVWGYEELGQSVPCYRGRQWVLRVDWM